MHTHEINNWKFIVEEYDTDQWFWSNADDESNGTFPSQCEALQDAINWVDNRARVERDAEEEAEIDRAYGTVEKQARSYWMGTRL